MTNQKQLPLIKMKAEAWMVCRKANVTYSRNEQILVFSIAGVHPQTNPHPMLMLVAVTSLDFSQTKNCIWLMNFIKSTKDILQQRLSIISRLFNTLEETDTWRM